MYMAITFATFTMTVVVYEIPPYACAFHCANFLQIWDLKQKTCMSHYIDLILVTSCIRIRNQTKPENQCANLLCW